MNNTIVKTLGQKRSEYALKQVGSYKDIPKLKNFSAGAPAMILQNGLGLMMAFCYAKKKNGDQYDAILKIIEGWIQEHPAFKKDFANSHGETFLSVLSSIDQQRYLAVQQETLALLEWVKRYANAFIDDKERIQ